MMPFTPHFEHLKIQIDAIKSATNNFADDNCIGRGGFGKVYKGELVLAKGKAVVAVKRLDRTFGQGNPEFWKEIMMLSIYKHENVVSLLGFCDESDEKILVYEYASRRSLDLYLKSDDLTWIRRLKICIGAARGLAYLHNPGRTQQRVLHRDIKSSNILLDENWNARISDLGLSKYGPANQQYTFLVSNVVGTIGYCDPVYVETGVLTKESDVYSFGVVLFEVLCGRLSFDNNDKLQPLTGLVRQCYRQNKINDIVYGNLKNQLNPNSLKAFTTIAYRCLKRDIEDRPLMTEVIRVLENALRYQLGDGDDNEEQEPNKGDIKEYTSVGEGTHVLHTRRTNKMLRMVKPALLVGKGDNVEEYPDEVVYKKALQLSVQEGAKDQAGQADMDKLLADQSFVSSILASLPGVDPNDPSVKDLLASMQNQSERDSTYSRLGSARESPMMTPSINKEWNRNYYKPADQGGNHHFNVGPSAYGAGGPKGEVSSMEASRTTTSSRDEASISVSNASDMESEWIEQDEPGVYITIRQLTDGTRELRRVRFSREKFGEVHAEQWWEQNRERIQSQYL